MKKALFLCVLGVWILLLCGCNNGNNEDNDSFEHYDLKDKKLNVYTYYNDDEEKLETYALADITPGSYESVLTGFFYKIGNDDYILLETLEYSQQEAYKKKHVYQFYGNKLYGVGNGDSPMIFEIELKGKESKIKELKFKINDKINPFLTSTIKNIDKNLITFYGNIFIGEHSENKYFECSLENYECSIKDNE